MKFRTPFSGGLVLPMITSSAQPMPNPTPENIGKTRMRFFQPYFSFKWFGKEKFFGFGHFIGRNYKISALYYRLIVNSQFYVDATTSSLFWRNSVGTPIRIGDLDTSFILLDIVQINPSVNYITYNNGNGKPTMYAAYTHIDAVPFVNWADGMLTGHKTRDDAFHKRNPIENMKDVLPL